MRLLLSLLFMAKKKRRPLEETVEKIHQGDADLREDLIDSYKPFIAKTVSSVCKRYIYESDDEFSIGLIAFNEAIQKYSSEKGSSLLSFAEVMIKRRVIDYIRQQSRSQYLSFDSFQDPNEEEQRRSTLEDNLSLDEFQKKKEQDLRREEILQFQTILSEFDLSFQDLLEQSPKHVDARKNAMLVAKAMVENEELKNFLLEKRRMPIKQLEELVNVSRKTIERNRKYIIAIALILIGDYVFLKDYIKGVLET